MSWIRTPSLAFAISTSESCSPPQLTSSKNVVLQEQYVARVDGGKQRGELARRAQDLHLIACEQRTLRDGLLDCKVALQRAGIGA